MFAEAHAHRDAAAAENFKTNHRGAANKATTVRLASIVFGALSASIPVACTDRGIHAANYPGTKIVPSVAWSSATCS